MASDELDVDTFSIMIESTEIPEIPILSVPANNLINVDLEATFSWNNTDLTNSYRVRIGTDEALMSPVLDTVVNIPELELFEKLNVDTEYYWGVTSEGACTDVTSETFKFRTTVIDATKDLSLLEIKMFPNPVVSELILEIPPHLGSKLINYKIVNPLGQVMAQKTLSSSTTIIAMDNYSSGVYYIKLESDKGLWTQAIFKL